MKIFLKTILIKYYKNHIKPQYKRNLIILNFKQNYRLKFIKTISQFILCRKIEKLKSINYIKYKCKCKSCKLMKFHPDLHQLNFKNFIKLETINNYLIDFKKFCINKNFISQHKILIIIFPEYFNKILLKIIINILKNINNKNLKLIIISNNINLIPSYLRYNCIKIYFKVKLNFLIYFNKIIIKNHIECLKYIKYILKYCKKSWNILNINFYKNYKNYIYFIKLIKTQFLFNNNIKLKIFLNLFKKFIYDILMIKFNLKPKYFKNSLLKNLKKININKILIFDKIINNTLNAINKNSNLKQILINKILFNFNLLIINNENE